MTQIIQRNAELVPKSVSKKQINGNKKRLGKLQSGLLL